MKKICRECAPKLIPDLFLILVNNPKQLLHARNSFTNQIFWKKIYKKLLKSQLYYFFRTACHPHVSRMSFVCHPYVVVFYPYVTRMYSYVIRMSLVCTHRASVCHSYILVCHSYVTRLWFYHESFLLLLVCTKLALNCMKQTRWINK